MTMNLTIGIRANCCSRITEHVILLATVLHYSCMCVVIVSSCVKPDKWSWFYSPTHNHGAKMRVTMHVIYENKLHV